MQSTGDGCVPELEDVARAALLPLVRYQADIVHIVMKHYQWAVQVDKLCYLEQQYEKMSRNMINSKEVARVDREFEILENQYVDEVRHYFVDPQRDAFYRELEEGDDRPSHYCRHQYALMCDAEIKLSEHITIINDVYSRVISKFSSLKMDVVQCHRFTNPNTDRSVRKKEAGKMATRRKWLLAQIDRELKSWDGRRAEMCIPDLPQYGYDYEFCF